MTNCISWLSFFRFTIGTNKLNHPQSVACQLLQNTNKRSGSNNWSWPFCCSMVNTTFFIFIFSSASNQRLRNNSPMIWKKILWRKIMNLHFLIHVKFFLSLPPSYSNQHNEWPQLFFSILWSLASTKEPPILLTIKKIKKTPFFTLCHTHHHHHNRRCRCDDDNHRPIRCPLPDGLENLIYVLFFRVKIFFRLTDTISHHILYVLLFFKLCFHFFSCSFIWVLKRWGRKLLLVLIFGLSPFRCTLHQRSFFIFLAMSPVDPITIFWYYRTNDWSEIESSHSKKKLYQIYTIW